jgi:hypothetical protein|tara:strand:- start:1374 stop:1625 length:252 start_codon:yes stop_codon:yes gene_type:complete
MAQTKQTTLRVDGDKVVLKARQAGTGIGGFRYTVNIWSSLSGDWTTKVLVRLIDLDGTDCEMRDQALWLAIEKGMAKWLKATK